MPIERLGDNQVLNRHCRVNTLLFGYIDTLVMGEITNATSTTTLATGQTRPTGQTQAIDVTGSVPFADASSVAKVEAWKALTAQGAEGRIQKGTSFQYYHEDGSPGPLVVAEEVYLHTVTYPSTDMSGSGDAAHLTFVLNVFNAMRLPGTI